MFKNIFIFWKRKSLWNLNGMNYHNLFWSSQNRIEKIINLYFLLIGMWNKRLFFQPCWIKCKNLIPLDGIFLNYEKVLLKISRQTRLCTWIEILDIVAYYLAWISRCLYNKENTLGSIIFSLNVVQKQPCFHNLCTDFYS